MSKLVGCGFIRDIKCCRTGASSPEASSDRLSRTCHGENSRQPCNERLSIRLETHFPLSCNGARLGNPQQSHARKTAKNYRARRNRFAAPRGRTDLFRPRDGERPAITELGTKADESRDHIKVQGKLLRPETERVYLLLNKPPEVVSTMIDPEGRRSLRDLLYGVSQRVFPVGRLEYHSLGLVFLTNDGELANRILKAHHLPQTYHLKLKTLLTFEEIESFRAPPARKSSASRARTRRGMK